MTSIRDPNLVHETGSDDTYWNAKVIREGETFCVQVYDADGDRRTECEDSFTDQALAIAFADKSILPSSERQMLNNVLGQPAAVPFYIWANADCANKTDDFEEAKRIRNSLINEGAEDAYIADADGVEVVDAEIEADEAAAAAGSH